MRGRPWTGSTRAHLLEALCGAAGLLGKRNYQPNNNGVASRKASSRLILVSCVVLQTFKGE